MSSIALLVTNLGDKSAKAQTLLMSSFAINLGAISSAVATRTPVLQRRLFDRHSPEFPHKLLAVMEQLEQLGSVFALFELQDGQAYTPDGSYYRITPDRLRNMISAREQSLEDRRRLADLENGEE